MANRYWVGGTENWDGTAGSKWATTDGGAGGAAIPGATDDVFLTAKPAPTWAATTAYALAAIVSPVTGNGYFYECTTAGTTAGTEPTWPTTVGNTVTDGTAVWTCRACTVTLASGNSGAKTIDFTGFTGTVAGTVNFTVRGNVTLGSGMTWTHSGSMAFQTNNATLITNGVTFTSVEVNTAGITLTLGDAFTSNGNISVTQGTFNTANYNVTATSLLSSNSNTRTITLGSSTITLTSSTGWSCTTSTNLTVNAGTSQINLSSSVASFDGGGKTYYNVSFTASAPNAKAMSGANTFNNLLLTAPSSAGISQLGITGNQTVNATFTASGASGGRRISLRAGNIGQAVTITAATFTPTDTDFRDITIAGAASPVSGTRLGDCGGNTNITFDAPKTVYWNPSASATFYSASWATSSGNTTLSEDNVPLAQDTAIIDQNSRAEMSGVSDRGNVGTIDMSNRTSALTVRISQGGSLTIYGNFKFGTGITPSGAGGIVFAGRNTTQTITSNGIAFPSLMSVTASGSTVELADALQVSSGSLQVSIGTFDAKTYNVTTPQFVCSTTGTRSVKLGSGTWTITGTGAVWNFSTTTGLTFDKGTANIVLSNTSTSSRSFAGGGLTYNKLTIGGATGTSTTTISGTNTFSELASTKTVAHTITFTAGTTTTVGAWTITGTAGNVVTLQSSSTSSYTLNKTGGGTVSVDYMSISRSTATPGSTWYAGANSTDGGNNSGWSFTVPPAAAVGTFLMLF